MLDDACFITRLSAGGHGPAVAVKDLIDVAGIPTTAGCRAVAQAALPAECDAACLRGLREHQAQGALHLAGKTNLHELAFGITGINRWTGTPKNPLDRRRVPGGSSSGSAVAVATGRAEMALGTDTGGSIRIPAACCGIAGLKTTFGRIALEGVRPLAPTLDTVGPLARTVEGLVWGMRLLEPGFDISNITPPRTIGRFRRPCVHSIDEAIDRALDLAGFVTVDVDLPGWDLASSNTMAVIAYEAFESNGYLIATGKVGDDVAERIIEGSRVTPADRARLSADRTAWRSEVGRALGRGGLIALPTLSDFAPLLEEAFRMYELRQTHPVNLAGLPALALPVPTGHGLPGSLQLIGPHGSEEQLLAAGLRLEAAAGWQG